MPDYSAMYKRLFNAQVDAIRILQTAHQDTEERYVSSPDPKIRLLDNSHPKDSENQNQEDE